MPRFTIRDVLWLTVVVALAVGWWIDHRRQAGIIDFQEWFIQSETELKEINAELKTIPPPRGPAATNR